MKQNIIIRYFIICLLLVACAKDDVLPILDKDDLEKQLSPEQQKIVSLNKKAAILMSKISQDPLVREEIYESVKAITQKYEWRDESVYFKEILPNNWNEILQRRSFIAIALNKELGINSNTKTSGVSNNEILNELITNNVEFYFPYHEDFPEAENFTVTYQDEINEYEKEGVLIIDGEKNIVLVNDNYAIQNPVLVIGQFNNNRFAPEENTNTGNQRTIFDPMYVNIGQIKYTNDHEGLMMGGPEFTFYRAKGTINVNNQNNYVTTQDRVNKDFKRKDKNKWHNVNSMIDHSWNILELSQVFGIYERDGGIKELINLNVNIKKNDIY